jgi:peptidoglycan/LPS O-acetylase OafA/YrhL
MISGDVMTVHASVQHTIYLAHWMIVALCVEWRPAGAVGLFFALVGLIGTGATLHHLVERPRERLRRAVIFRAWPVMA